VRIDENKHKKELGKGLSIKKDNLLQDLTYSTWNRKPDIKVWE